MHTLSQQKKFYSTGLRERERETRNFNFGFKKIALIFSFSKLTNFERGKLKESIEPIEMLQNFSEIS
jgi:hypothetical protein